MSLRIGNLELKHPVIQSPMCGCTDLAYRRIARAFGCLLAFPEMVKDRPVIENNRKTQELLKTAEWDRPLGIQMVGREPDLMAEAARRLEAHGADLVDINLGCPVPKVTKAGCGSALLKEPGHFAKILEKMVPAINVPVTVKMRTGFENEPDGAFLEIAKICEDQGVAAITVHGRTRLQRFKGMTNFDAIRAAKETVSIPVIGNGNVNSGPAAKEMMDKTGCDGVMVARGALGNPWIYREVASYLETGETLPRPTIAERAKVLRDHFAYLREFNGDRRAFYHIRHIIHWFVKGVYGGRDLRLRGNRIESVEEFEAVVTEFENMRAVA